MKIIVGLGNPGSEYDGTRHNAGFLALDKLALAHGFSWTKDAKRKAMTAKGTIDGADVLLAKPLTYMNDSGEAVQSLLTFYKGEPKDLLIVHDEMDFETGRIAFLADGGHAGHNGVRDIQERLGRKDIPRIRIGIGRPMEPIAKEDWVLTKPRGEDEQRFLEGVDRAVEEISSHLSS
jgi:PTH1 family peptidyl-tRNA hydrolase